MTQNEQNMPDESPRPGSLRATGIGKRYRRPIRLISGPLGDDDDEDDDLGLDELEVDDAEETATPDRRTKKDSRGLWQRLRSGGQESWALHDVSFSIAPGERVAIIGANGSGKSTLLRILAGVTPPSVGNVVGAGMILPLWAIRTPLDPHRTGRQNLLAIARLMGIDGQTAGGKIQEAAAFAEMEDVVDARVSTYSKTMFARLGASLAMFLSPDILLIDDSYLAGDEIFKSKLQTAFVDLLEQKKTLIFATNNIGIARQHCSRAIWMREGTIAADGEIAAVLQAFITSGDDEHGDFAEIFGAAEATEKRALRLGAEASTNPDDDRVAVPHVEWTQLVAHAETLWEKSRIRKRQRIRESKRPYNRGSINPEVPGDLGMIASLRATDDDDTDLVAVLPGENITLRVRFDVYKPDTRVFIRLENDDPDLMLVMVSEPLYPIEIHQPGQYEARVRIPGDLMGDTADTPQIKLRTRVFFAEIGADAPSQQVDSTIRVTIRGDVRQGFDAQLGQMGAPVSAHLQRAPVTLISEFAAEPQPVDIGSLWRSNRHYRLWRKPVLRPHLEWSVWQLLTQAEYADYCSRSDETNEETGVPTPQSRARIGSSD